MNEPACRRTNDSSGLDVKSVSQHSAQLLIMHRTSSDFSHHVRSINKNSLCALLRELVKEHGDGNGCTLNSAHYGMRTRFPRTERSWWPVRSRREPIRSMFTRGSGFQTEAVDESAQMALRKNKDLS